MSRVAVTGAAGFVGRHLVPPLQSDGHQVRALTHLASTAGSLPGDVSVTNGDIRTPETMRVFLDRAEAVVHLASSYGLEGPEVVEAGTRAVVEAARAAEVGRFVLLSCLPAQAASRSPYFRAKWKAEQIVRGSGIPYVVLRSALVLGAGDSIVGPLAELIKAYPVVPLPGDGRQRQQPVDVDDLARCIAAAVSDDALLNQEVSVAGPMFLTLRQLVDLIQGQLGLAKPKLLVPPAVWSVAARLFPTTARELFLGSRLGDEVESPAASPGIVEARFHFEPRSIPKQLARYLEPVATLA